MIYSTEHLVFAFFLGLVLGVVSTLFGTKRDLTKESIVSLLIMTIWLSMHGYGFLFEQSVPWLMDFAGFGAAGNFIGVTVADLHSGIKSFKKK